MFCFCFCLFLFLLLFLFLFVLLCFVFEGGFFFFFFKKKIFFQVWINQGDIILIGLRDFQGEKADVILKYTSDEARNLKTYGELPENGVFQKEFLKHSDFIFLIYFLLWGVSLLLFPFLISIISPFAARINETTTFGEDGMEEDVVFDDVEDDDDIDDVSCVCVCVCVCVCLCVCVCVCVCFCFFLLFLSHADIVRFISPSRCKSQAKDHQQKELLYLLHVTCSVFVRVSRFCFFFFFPPN